ncbi:MAG TPA: YihY family inner membrane protein [Alphaproteobacteria bacterium]|nr:YihY family inner membrane protein [Alphaproteobacteria bacterium]
MKGTANVRRVIWGTGSLLWYALCRFQRDGCLTLAASLSYTTLLAIVPLLTLALGFITGFSAFDDIHARIQSFILQNLVPQAGAAVTSALTSFVENAGKATSVGILGLAFTSIMLLSTINSAFNQIWRVKKERPILLRVLVYWTIISLGPILFGTALSLSGSIYSELTGDRGLRRLISSLIPFGIGTLAFTLLYTIAPNRPVRWRHALAAGFAAAILFELLKVGYVAYLREFPTYQSIYGALSAIPIFLVWMYLCWAVTLLGAELAAALPEWQSANALKEPERNPRPGERLTLALVLLNRMLEASREQGPIAQEELIDGLAAPIKWVDCELQALSQGGFIERTLRGDWVLSRDLEELTVGDLYRGLDLTPTPADAAPSSSLAPDADWPAQLEEILAEVKEAEREAMRVPVKRLLLHQRGQPLPMTRQHAAGAS